MSALNIEGYKVGAKYFHARLGLIVRGLASFVDKRLTDVLMKRRNITFTRSILSLRFCEYIVSEKKNDLRVIFGGSCCEDSITDLSTSVFSIYLLYLTRTYFPLPGLHQKGSLRII